MSIIQRVKTPVGSVELYQHNGWTLKIGLMTFSFLSNGVPVICLSFEISELWHEIICYSQEKP